MRLSARGFTLPWQLVELQEPGPVYLPASAGGFAAHTGFNEAKRIAPSQTTAHPSVKRLASGPILIPVLGWTPPYSRGPWSQPASEFLYCPPQSKSTKAKPFVSVAAMENPIGVKMDSKAGVCYMNFGVRGHSFACSAFPEEHRLAF